MIDLTKFQHYQHTKKVWGKEILLTNPQNTFSPNQYCSKLMVVESGWQCSLHRHLVKDETFFILDGVVIIETSLDGEKLSWDVFTAGDSIHIRPKVWHRFKATNNPVLMLEVSTPHSDGDVERMEESRRCD